MPKNIWFEKPFVSLRLPVGYRDGPMDSIRSIISTIER